MRYSSGLREAVPGFGLWIVNIVAAFVASRYRSGRTGFDLYVLERPAGAIDRNVQREIRAPPLRKGRKSARERYRNSKDRPSFGEWPRVPSHCRGHVVVGVWSRSVVQSADGGRLAES